MASALISNESSTANSLVSNHHASSFSSFTNPFNFFKFTSQSSQSTNSFEIGTSPNIPVPSKDLIEHSPLSDDCVVKKFCKNFINTNTSTTTTTTTASSANTSCSLIKNKNIFSLLNREAPVEIEQPKIESCAQFIDPFELKNKIMQMAQNVIIILLDCRSYNDYNSKRIKDSIHLNCRDKLSKKRLLTRKITVKDLISSESIKSKFDSINNNSNGDSQFSSVNNCHNSNSNSSDSSCSSSSGGGDGERKEEDLIIIYDDTTSDLKDLQSESNPLKIVQDNITQSGFNKDCKILKGGFKQFSEICPEYVEEVLKLNNSSNNAKYYDNQHDQHQGSIDNAVMTKIEPFLYLGNELDAKNIAALEKQGIYYILNVTKNIPFYDHLVPESSKSKFVFKRIGVNDACNQNLKQYFDEAFQFIDEALQNDSKVLVHCQAGVSRSPTIVIAYLMRRHRQRMNDAYARVREMRPIVAPNLIFMSQLMDFETKLFGSTCSSSSSTGVQIELNNNNNNNTSSSSSSSTTKFSSCSSTFQFGSSFNEQKSNVNVNSNTNVINSENIDKEKETTAVSSDNNSKNITAIECN